MKLSYSSEKYNEQCLQHVNLLHFYWTRRYENGPHKIFEWKEIIELLLNSMKIT